VAAVPSEQTLSQRAFPCSWARGKWVRQLAGNSPWLLTITTHYSIAAYRVAPGSSLQLESTSRSGHPRWLARHMNHSNAILDDNLCTEWF